MLENISTCMYHYTIGYNRNIYKNLVSNYHVDNKDYFWTFTWITKYYYVILYSKQHTLLYKSIKLLALSCRDHSGTLPAAGVRTLFQGKWDKCNSVTQTQRGKWVKSFSSILLLTNVIMQFIKNVTIYTQSCVSKFHGCLS